MKFFVRTPDSNIPKGPFELAEVAEHIRKAWLPESATVAQPGSHQWVPVLEIPELAVAFGQLRASGKAPPMTPRAYVPPGALSCPQCKGAASGGRGCGIIALIILTFPIGLLFLLVKPTYRCGSCGYSFQP